MTTLEPLVWLCEPQVAKLFVALLEQAQFEDRELPEVIDRVRSLPNFPVAWTPGRPIRLVITHPASRPLIQVPR